MQQVFAILAAFFFIGGGGGGGEVFLLKSLEFLLSDVLDCKSSDKIWTGNFDFGADVL